MRQTQAGPYASQFPRYSELSVKCLFGQRSGRAAHRCAASTTCLTRLSSAADLVFREPCTIKLCQLRMWSMKRWLCPRSRSYRAPYRHDVAALIQQLTSTLGAHDLAGSALPCSTRKTATSHPRYGPLWTGSANWSVRSRWTGPAASALPRRADAGWHRLFGLLNSQFIVQIFIIGSNAVNIASGVDKGPAKGGSLESAR